MIAQSSAESKISVHGDRRVATNAL